MEHVAVRDLPNAAIPEGVGRTTQVVIALVVTPDDLPLAYEMLPGNTADTSALRGIAPEDTSPFGAAE
jgi:hypothetical protein